MNRPKSLPLISFVILQVFACIEATHSGSVSVPHSPACREIDKRQRRWVKDDDKRGPNEGATFVTKNGDRFFIFGENGDLVIARLTPEKYDEISRTKLLDPVGVGLGRPVVWSHPAYANRCVYARNDREIVCVDLSAN